MQDDSNIITEAIPGEQPASDKESQTQFHEVTEGPGVLEFAAGSPESDEEDSLHKLKNQESSILRCGLAVQFSNVKN